jgi:hypothetical protein
MVGPEDCIPGKYQTFTRQQVCNPCPLGTYCPETASIHSIKCDPGTVCSLTSQLTPPQLCPSGSYCVINIATTRVQYAGFPVENYPIECEAGTYCL